jgi:EAL domain-containing protein (putative c-di-GMP-specific phosphodiesterase class I)
LPLGEWALTEACRTAAQWPDELDIAVNLSPVQLTSPDLVSNIVRILGETGLHPNRLTLEITERTLVEDSDRTLSVLNELKQLGIQISLDDFGTGYSSLSYLRSYPFDTIKIDRTFVSNLREGAESNVIVQAIILIATRLGMRTIAEGVETELQKQILNMLGCHEMQGYLLNRPVPITQVPMLLAQWLYAKTASAYGVAPRRSSSNRRSRLVPAPTLRLVP